ncbi:outer membrane beta-barrel protein [Mucilaginibacter jinjuensis]|uniref:TonB-dependent receptor n=1 Tax=Mucilaginibacter jinjuensis TaxID=1176721 RepID=A0ABY7TCY8_9SPHI|nr:outer membrane beta-barrel protein [Mucilaginibacter jinjuensis]WCT13930.1 TonB-dependent receptor [Mucilaginibacter jinjuensis]
MGGLDRGGAAFSRATLGVGATGKQTKTLGGININTDYGKKLKVNLSYVFSRAKTEYNMLINRQQVLNDTTTTTNNNNNSLNTSYTHNITASVRWHPNDTTQLTYNPSVYIRQNETMGNILSNSFSNFINPINNRTSDNNSSGNSFQFQHSFNYNHQFNKKGESVSVDHNLSISPGSGFNYSDDNLASYIPTFPSYSLKRKGDNDNQNTDVNLSATYRKPIVKKLIADLKASTGYNHQLDKVSTYDYNPITGQYDSFLLELSSDLTRNKWTEALTPGITYNISQKVMLMAHLNAQWQQVDNSFKRNTADIDQHFFYLLPSVNLNISRLSISYNRSVQLPNIGDMIPYTVVFSPLYSVTGNPNLKPTTQDNFSINFNKYNYQSGSSFSVSASASFEQNNVFRQRTINADLVETSMPVNRNGRYTYNVGGFFNKQIKKNKDFRLSSRSNINLSTGRTFFIVNQQSGYQYNYNINFTEGLSLNWKDKIEIDPQYTLSKAFITYSGGAFSNQNTLVHTANAHFNIFLPQKFNIEGYYTYMYNPLVAPGFQKSSNLLSLSLAHQLLKKDRGEIKLSSYDILNQNISSYRYVSENIITDTQSEVVKRYFMLTLQFKFNKSTTKEEEKKPVLMMR